MKGLVTNIQRYSLHDGLGIRTIVFLAGCPLRCRWCANPETQKMEPQLLFHAAKCIGCQTCRQVCPQQLDLPGNVDRECCTRCGTCRDACPTGALELVGTERSVDEVLRVVEKDRRFYKENGGMTLSGGEPLMQWEFAAALAEKASMVHHLPVALETTGYAKWEHLAAVARYCDEILYDIKHLDDERHRYGTLVGNGIILENLKKLAAEAADRIILRIPLIDGYNADDQNICALCALGTESGVKEIHLLPYHRFGEPKYAKLGLAYDFDGQTPEDEALEKIRRRIAEKGFQVEVGG